MKRTALCLIALLAAPGLSRAQSERRPVTQLSTAELQRRLTRTGRVRVRGNLIYIDGVLLYSPHADRARATAIVEREGDELLPAVKELHVRILMRTLYEAERASPAPEGYRYVFNEDTGRAELEADPPYDKGDATR